MELEDLKNIWNNASDTNQPELDRERIGQIIANKYNAGRRKIALPEIAGMIVCVSTAIFIAARFNSLDTLLLQGTGLAAIVLLLLLTLISAASLRQLGPANFVQRSYVEALQRFARQKMRFYKLQRLNILLSNLLLVLIIVLLHHWFQTKHQTAGILSWIYPLSAGYIFLLFYAGWVLKHYRKITGRLEDLLRELDS